MANPLESFKADLESYFRKMAGITPVGHLWFGFDPKSKPAGVQLYSGQLLARAAYMTHYTFVTTHRTILTEDEWQAYVTANGFCPYYSSGDGSTTYRMPLIKNVHPQFVAAIAEAGQYIEAGLPNITGTIGRVGNTNGTIIKNGTKDAFSVSSEYKGAYAGGGARATGEEVTLSFNASNSNSIYGNSDTVQPPSLTFLIGEYVYSSVAPIGTTNIEVRLNNIEESFNSIISATVSKEGWWSPSLFTSAKTSITLPAGMIININDVIYTSTVVTTLNVSTVSNPVGKDVYIYACAPTSGTEPVFVLSMNSTVPSGYTVDSSRKIGGFHCLCADVGIISDHPLSGYVAGDILPATRWDLTHRPLSDPEGMFYNSTLDIWCDIYLASWDGTKLVSVYGGTTADGTSTKKWHGEAFCEQYSIYQNKRLPWRREFQVMAKGSNEETNIYGGADVGTTGGHVDTKSRRMISNDGGEDMCGFLWQWLEDLGFAGGSGWTESVYNSGVDSAQYGQTYGTLFRLLGGGPWDNGACCGSRSASCDSSSANVYAIRGGRGVAEPKNIRAYR